MVIKKYFSGVGFTILTVLFFVGGCISHRPQGSKPPPQGPLFPDGTYHQDLQIRIDVPEKNVHEEFSFRAVVKKEKDHLVVLAYNRLGFTLFRLEEHPPQDLQWTTEVEMINKHKEFFLKMYPQIKKLLQINGAALRSEGEQYVWQEDKVRIDFNSFDSFHRPLKMEMSDQKHYWVQIENLYDDTTPVQK